MRMIKFRAKRVNGGEWVKSMTISYGTIKRKMYNVFFEVEPNKWVGVIPETVCQFSELTGQRGHFELPRVSYQTSKGNVVLFPDEIMPVDINLLQQEINEGYIMLSDGRYLPPKEAVQQCYNAFGIRVGLGDNWEDIYDGWNKEMK